ncbi:UMP-CMP kinase 2, mitochondrial-like [Macrosteles quadrilineatus]|uniref:UMP-CMP kinase 2, mitochondrial-like n=1 Tax=Macrosteles quadrilineatus TaxID=74068 RepID=UPI0023E21017|nr:UMP-CMP kinase 2, mitochondrial-like [Macrosteles quadrilineatus]
MVQLGANITDANLRKAFFGLTGYVAACTARHLTRTLPAVVTGHWMSQAAFAIAKVYDQVPPSESLVYSWPQDLYPPDIVFFMNSKRKKERRRDVANPEFLEKFVQVYRNWRKPPVFEISNTYQYEAMANKMIEIINQQFQGNY